MFNFLKENWFALLIVFLLMFYLLIVCFASALMGDVVSSWVMLFVSSVIEIVIIAKLISDK